MIFSFGIEHEVAFLTHEAVFADFSSTSFSEFNQVIESLPTYPDDYLKLHIGDAGIRKKRWYIEGFERFTDSGEPGDCLPKGIEIRTTIHPSIQSTIDELSRNFSLLSNIAFEAGFSPVLTSFNPYKVAFKPDPPLNKYELQQLQDIKLDEQTATIHMVTYGPDLNFSIANLSIENSIDIGRKLVYYSPYVLPFSYSSPFYNGHPWQGLSIRTFIRSGQRPTALVYVQDRDQLIHNTPLLTKIARLPAEVGRIEFKAFDSCDDFSIYAALLALLKGLAIDESLPGRAATPDLGLHKISAVAGFEDEDIYLNATAVLQAAELALRGDPDINLLAPLKLMLAERKTIAHTMIDSFKRLGSIEKALKGTYQR
jgi:hypothetical protein